MAIITKKKMETLEIGTRVYNGGDMANVEPIVFGPTRPQIATAGSFPTIGVFQVDASDEGVAWVIQMPEAATITG